MKVLKFNNKSFQAEKIIKKADSIIGYIGNDEVFAFRGISDWSLFTIEGGNFDPDPDEITSQTIAQLTLENADLKTQLQTLAQTIATMQLGGV